MFRSTGNRPGALNYLNIAAICLLWVSNFAQAQTKDAKSTEVLIVPPYPSEPHWKEITNKKNNRMELVEWAPVDQTGNSKGLFVRQSAIRDILTKQIFYDLKDEDPSAFVSKILAGVGKACQRARVNGPKARRKTVTLLHMLRHIVAIKKGLRRTLIFLSKPYVGKTPCTSCSVSFDGPLDEAQLRASPKFQRTSLKS